MENEFKPIHTKCKDEFHRVFEVHNGVEYLDWNGMQARHLYLFLKKIKNHLTKINKPAELDDVFNAYSVLLQCLPSAWLKMQGISVISGRLSQIIVEIKAAHKKTYSSPAVTKNMDEVNQYLNEQQ